MAGARKWSTQENTVMQSTKHCIVAAARWQHLLYTGSYSYSQSQFEFSNSWQRYQAEILAKWRQAQSVVKVCLARNHCRTTTPLHSCIHTHRTPTHLHLIIPISIRPHQALMNPPPSPSPKLQTITQLHHIQPHHTLSRPHHTLSQLHNTSPNHTTPTPLPNQLQAP